MEHNKKEEVITFKVDKVLAEKMRAINNRSEFIRAAILAALDNVCPLCSGTGVLTPNQVDHWRDLMRTYHMGRCDHCGEVTVLPGSSAVPSS